MKILFCILLLALSSTSFAREYRYYHRDFHDDDYYRFHDDHYHYDGPRGYYFNRGDVEINLGTGYRHEFDEPYYIEDVHGNRVLIEPR